MPESKTVKKKNDELKKDIFDLEQMAIIDTEAYEHWGRTFEKVDNIFRWIEIILSGITAGTFIQVIFGGGLAYEIIGATCILAFVSSSVLKNINYANKSSLNRKAASSMENISLQCDYLLTDFDGYTLEEIRKKRDMLTNLYKETKNTCPVIKIKKSDIAYEVALKTNEKFIELDNKKKNNIETKAPSEILKTENNENQ